MKKLILLFATVLFSVSLTAQFGVNSTLSELQERMPFGKYVDCMPILNMRAYIVNETSPTLNVDTCVNVTYVIDETDTCRYAIIIPNTIEDVKWYVGIYHDAFFSPSPNANYWITQPYDNTNRTYKITIVKSFKDFKPCFVWEQNPDPIASKQIIDNVEVTSYE
jgi:hypothetical protein